VAWRTLHHPNVLPLLGVAISGNRLAMVSEWMEKGNINEFLVAEVNADRLKLVCFSFKALTFADDWVTAAACRCNSGVDLYAWRGNSPWGS